MKKKSHMLIKEFADLTGIKKDNLRFYDQSGLLCPEIRGENGYRYYSRHQLNTAFLISDLRELKLGLVEIKEYATQRTPDTMLELFEKQEKVINDEIQHLNNIREIMRLRSNLVREAKENRNNTFMMKEMEEDPIFLCPIPPSEMNEDEKCMFSYEYAFEKQVHLSYPLGVILAYGEDSRYETVQYYFKTKRMKNAKKDKGKYAVAYGESNQDHIGFLCQRLVDYVESNQMRIHGNLYVEWLLDELSLHDSEQYFVRVQVRIDENDEN